MKKLQKSHAYYILVGSMLSTTGSLTYFMAQLSYLKALGFSLAAISIFVGSVRGATILSMFFAGRIADRFSEKAQLLILEAGAAVCSVGLFYLLPSIQAKFVLFTVIAGLRSYFLSLQIGARAKILKIIGEGASHLDHKYAILNNIVTHGPMLFAALITYISYSRVPFKFIILFDLFTFLLNGFLIFYVPNSDKQYRHNNESWLRFIYDLYKHAPLWAFLDAVLALGMAGLVMMMVRIAGDRPIDLALYYVAYGLSVWLSGYFALKNPQPKHILLWSAGLAIAFQLLNVADQLVFKLIAYTIICFCYWVLFHSFSSKIQQCAPTKISGSIHSARTFQMLIILVLGEASTGYWVDAISFQTEVIVRGIICLTIGVIFLYVEKRHRGNHSIHDASKL